MKKLRLLFGIAALSTFGLSSAQTLFYGGDFDGRDGLVSQMNAPGSGTYNVYDDFSIQSDSTVTGVFGNFQDRSTFRGETLYWEIRSGVSSGNGGTLIRSGTDTATAIATGVTAFGSPEYHYESNITQFILSAGTYFLSVAVVGGNGFTYLSTTSGSNGVGGPLANDNSFFSRDDFGGTIKFRPASQSLQLSPADFSMGVRGVATTPEPGTIFSIGFGLCLYAYSRKKVKLAQ